MKGIIFNTLESFICEGWGDDTYEEILSLCPLKTKEPFVGPGTYPDTDLVMIASQAAQKLGLPLGDALRAFGHYAFPKLATKVPALVDKNAGAKAFLLSIDSVVHVEVRKLYPHAITPKFDYDDIDKKNALIIHYSSKRQMCTLMEGLIDGVAEYFGTTIRYEQRQCTGCGDARCEFHLQFAD
jgi:Haem-NO-binding